LSKVPYGSSVYNNGFLPFLMFFFYILVRKPLFLNSSSNTVIQHYYNSNALPLSAQLPNWAPLSVPLSSRFQSEKSLGRFFAIGRRLVAHFSFGPLLPFPMMICFFLFFVARPLSLSSLSPRLHWALFSCSFPLFHLPSKQGHFQPFISRNPCTLNLFPIDDDKARAVIDLLHLAYNQ